MAHPASGAAAVAGDSRTASGAGAAAGARVGVPGAGRAAVVGRPGARRRRVGVGGRGRGRGRRRREGRGARGHGAPRRARRRRRRRVGTAVFTAHTATKLHGVLAVVPPALRHQLILFHCPDYGHGQPQRCRLVAMRS